MSLEFEKKEENIVKIQVIGVGGGGCNVVNRMVESGTKDVEFIAVNTDLQVLNKCSATMKIQIGQKLTGGKGAGADPEKGKKSAEENRQEISELLSGTDMVFITAGMGGGTGTGAAPVIAQIAKEMGILTVAVVTKPFRHEREKRMQMAERGIVDLYQYVDSLVVIANDNVRKTLPKDKKVTLVEGFAIVDSVLQHAVSSLTELIQIPGYINLDFADVNTVMRGAGLSHMGYGMATGENKAETAVRLAVESPLLDVDSVRGAKGIILNIVGPMDLDLDDPDLISDYVKTITAPDVNFIYGVALDDTLSDEVRVTVIAAGIDQEMPPTLKKDSILSQKPEESTLPEPLTMAEQPAPIAPVEQPAPVQPAPVQQAPVQQAPVQQAPVQEAPVQQAPIQQAPVQQAPVQQAPVQEAPVQQAPVQQAPLQQATTQQVPPPSLHTFDPMQKSESKENALQPPEPLTQTYTSQSSYVPQNIMHPLSSTQVQVPNRESNDFHVPPMPKDVPITYEIPTVATQPNTKEQSQRSNDFHSIVKIFED